MDTSHLPQLLAPILPYLLKGEVEFAKSAATDDLQCAADKPDDPRVRTVLGFYPLASPRRCSLCS